MSTWSPQHIINALVVSFGLFYQTTCCLMGMMLSSPVYHYGSRPLYLQWINYILQIWSESLVAVFQVFSPSTLVFTLDGSCFKDSSSSSPVLTLDNLVERNDQGQVTRLVFPDRVIVTLNHQVSQTGISPFSSHSLVSTVDLCGLGLCLVYCLLDKSSRCGQDHSQR